MRYLLTAFALLGTLMTSTVQADEKAPTEETVLNYTMESLDGKEIELGEYKGKVVLIVNVASKCGLTPQYAGLQELYEKYSDKGLVILGFPCNQFGGQEPGSAKEIAQFCESKYDVSFPMFAKVDVNGDKACELYKQLTQIDVKPKGEGKVSWNFEKFLVGRDGKLVARFEPPTKPDDADFVAAIEKLLESEAE